VTTVELVRHAKAFSRDSWWGKPDRDRPLTEAGFAQARALARRLAGGAPVDVLYSSPFLRCTQTLEPLARLVDLEIRDEEALSEAVTLPVLERGDAWVASAWLGGRGVGFLNRVIAEGGDRRIVACSHGDVIPALLAVLVGRDELSIGDVHLRKGARVTLTFNGYRCVGVAQHPAPEE
jgi:8-oxo-dGTP diphosphatase